MDAYVHITGNVGGDVEFRNTTVPLATFRLACTPRIRRGGEWVDADTTWLSVACWRGLAENVASSIKKGDPVVVVGKLRTSTFKREDAVVARTTLDAYSVGHDLSRGTSVFRKNERQVPDDTERESELDAALNVVESQPVTAVDDGDAPDQRAA